MNKPGEPRPESDVTQLLSAHRLLRSDPKLALTKLKALAEQGSIDAMLHVGQSYSFGRGVEQSFDEAERWFRRAAAEGSLSAYYGLAQIYMSQHRDKEAVQVLETAVARRYVAAIHILGRMYLEGRGVEQNHRKAEQLLARAAAAGNIMAKAHLGRLLACDNRGLRVTIRGVTIFLTAFLEIIVETFRKGPASERLK